MAQRRLKTVLTEFLNNLGDCRQLSAEAHHLAPPGLRGRQNVLTVQKWRDRMTEMAFLRAFLAWESFLEETFVLYLSGQSPPRGRTPKRNVVPLSQNIATTLIFEGRGYAQWTSMSVVRERADRFFSHGRPFGPILAKNTNSLDEVNTIRNAIAHRSGSARERFETLVRTKIRTLPANLTVGGFLQTTEPGSSPPASFFEFYVAKIDLAAQLIVPS